jgi:hypothetical protein
LRAQHVAAHRAHRAHPAHLARLPRQRQHAAVQVLVADVVRQGRRGNSRCSPRGGATPV